MERLTETLRREIRQIDGDPLLVECILAWHGLIGGKQVPWPHGQISQTVKRRTKRRLLRKWGSLDPKKWKEILKEWRNRPYRKLHKNLLKMEPLPEAPSHRPRDVGKWMALCDLRNYFKRILGRPQMILIQKIMGLKMVYSHFYREWYCRKDWFNKQEAEERLDRLRTFYSINGERIQQALETGVPLYQKYVKTGL